ncbi:MAG: DUF6482 family protein [Halioglobus sp.]
MKMSIAEASKWPSTLAAVVHSIDMVGYQASVVIDSDEYRLVDVTGKPLRCKNLTKMREMLRALPLTSIVLRHTSAYDEMVAQPIRQANNTLEVSVALESSLDTNGG